LRPKITAADDFFVGLFETALEPGEILTSVRFRVPDAAHYLKFRHPASGYAVVGVTGAGPNAFRLTEFEEALSGRFAPDSIANLSVDASELLPDMHASAV
jgi:carbon-monoxide dehydrogenase medium subunit